ncbi:MFS transporter [Selenomonas sp.]|uniref:MFS transporter n=1 Tax=Selenomonas sp. TaxID=2053611 RepID=UPI0025E714CD|nr:MFS transporter [Selenomonas sp.]MCI6084970.1 MFS transporter [Selenomonas sp.]MCI6284454.1 MFS transporter [Selenomonas sp.]
MNRFDPRIYLFTLGHFSVDWAQGAIPALLPYFIATCHLNYQDAGTLIFANILLSSIAQPVFGYYADRVSKPWFVPAGPVISGVSLAVLPFVTDYWLIFLCSMLSGFGSAVYHPEAARMVNGLGGAQKGKALGAFSVGGNTGFAVGPMFAGFCAYVFDIHGLVFYGVFNVVAALLIHRYMSGILADIAKEQREEQAAHAGVARENDWPSFGKLSLAILARSTGFCVCNAFIPLFWIHVLGTSEQAGSFALTCLFALGAVITFFGGVLSDRIGFVRMMRVSFLVMIPVMFLLIHTTDVTVATLLLIPAAFALFAPYSGIVVLGQTYLGKNIAFASGVTLGLQGTLGGLVTPLVGRAADHYGIVAALQILWMVAILGAVASFLLHTPKALEH